MSSSRLKHSTLGELPNVKFIRFSSSFIFSEYLILCSFMFYYPLTATGFLWSRITAQRLT